MLSEAALSRLETAQRTAAALLALGELAELLDPEDNRSRWEMAGELSQRLTRFESTAGRRITAGHRAPRDRLETLLSTIASDPGIGRTQRRLYELLD